MNAENIDMTPEERVALVRLLEAVQFGGERCRFDVLNPCWSGRPDDVPGRHWGGSRACWPCTAAGHAATLAGYLRRTAEAGALEEVAS